MHEAPFKPLILALLSVCSLGLAGCGETVPMGTAVIDFQAPPRDVVRVEIRNDTHTAYGDLRTGTISPAERQRLEAFVARFGDNRPDAIHAEIHGPGTTARLSRIADLLVGQGVERAKIKLFPGERAAAAGPAGTEPIMIAAQRGIAVLPSCPGWSNHVSAPGDNRVEPNLGCSDTSNFAAMVSDPLDLLKGQSSSYSDAEPAANAVAAYRNDKVKPLPAATTLTITAPAASGTGPSIGGGAQ